MPPTSDATIDAELLAEARDPTTSPGRLQQLFREGPRDNPGFARAMREALLTNPALPLDRLRTMLLMGDMRAWYNPSVPLFLMMEPRPEYREAARRLLARLMRMPARTSIESLIGHWSEPGLRPTTVRQVQVRDFAHHLASLFGLPWPAP